MFRAVKYFVDLLDNDHTYSKGDAFPREGVSFSEERIEQLVKAGLIKQDKRKKKAEQRR